MLEQNTFCNTDSNHQTDNYLGGYRITRQLATSAVSRTLLGETASLTEREPVVIKWFFTLHLPTPKARQEFLREAGRLRRLHHPGLLPILSAGIYTDTPYLVLPYMSQGSLFDRLQQPAGREWARSRALTLMRGLGQALAYAHQHDIVHGNLTTRNILLNAQDNILLADFSLTSLAAIQASTTGSASLPPHPITAPLPSPVNDIYALGCIAYELLTEHQPFPTQENQTNSADRPLPIAPSWFNTSIASSIDEAILKALAPLPAACYSDINAFLRALDPPTTTRPLVAPDDAKCVPPDQLPTVPIATLTGPLSHQHPATAIAQPTINDTPTSAIALPGTHRGFNPTSRPPSSQRPWSLFLLASALCLLIFGLIGSQLLTRLHPDMPRLHPTASHPTPNPYQNSLPITQASPTSPLAASPLPSPTLTIPPQIWPTPQPKSTPPPHLKLKHHPTPTPSFQASTGPLFATPARLSPQSCSLLDKELYHCIISLSLSDDAPNISTWEGSTDGLDALMAPQSGLISPGEYVQIVVQISAHCPLTGSLVFDTLDATVTVPWRC